MSAVAFAVAVAYTAVWMLACAAAVVVAVKRRRELVILTPAYWRFLAIPWKLATIALATGSLVILAPYAHDPSWDRVDATVMSLLTFATAPWVVAVLDRRRRGAVDGAVTYVAVCLMMFVSSWFYDLYLFVRDGGVYPPTWLGNLFVGPLLYVAGGVFWNLEAGEHAWQVAFRQPGWPRVPGGTDLSRIARPALALMLLAAAAFLPYLWPSARALVIAR
jgi:hypothetical protein